MKSGDPKTLIARLKLAPHPEGGYYREIYRSPDRVEWRGETLSAATAIYFLLQKGDKNWWHRIPQDELWHFYDGDPLELVGFNEKEMKLHRFRLSPENPAVVMPGGWWQAARTAGDFTLIGCTVSPGFEFRLFELLERDSVKLKRFRTAVDGFREFE